MLEDARADVIGSSASQVRANRCRAFYPRIAITEEDIYRTSKEWLRASGDMNV